MKKPVDKDQLIEKPEINTVGVITNHQFNWYICSNDMWTMDIDKYIQAYQEAGLDIDFSYLPEIQQNLHVITRSNLESYLEMYKDDWLKVTVEELIEMIKRSMDCEDLHSEIIFEGKGLLPNLLIDFDKEEFLFKPSGNEKLRKICAERMEDCFREIRSFDPQRGAILD